MFIDAYRLLCVFMADKAIFDMTLEDQQVFGGPRQSEEPLFRLHHQYMEDEINHTLINLAICNRTHMERRLKDHERHYPKRVCGKWTNGVGAQKEVKNLSFREACNKIIHAEKFAATFLKDGTITRFAGEMERMHHEMWLFGKYAEKEWKVDLDVFDFIRATADNFEFY